MAYRPTLKVLHICQRDDPTTGGAVRVAVEYVKRLLAYDIDAHCLFVYGAPGYFCTELGDRAHYLGLTSSRDVSKFFRLPQFIRKFHPDIIHHHDGLLWVQILTFCHPGIAKVVHGHITAKPQSLFSKGFLAAWLQRQSTDFLVAITQDTRQSYIQHQHYLPENVVVIYNGVDQARFRPPTTDEQLAARLCLGLPPNAPVVGFVGRLHCAMKGTDDFLRVVAFLPPTVWGVVVGDGPDADMLKALAKDLGIDNRVVFTGLLDNPAFAYQAMTVFCLTSNNEPFGLVVAEAMSSNLPVIGFDCDGGAKELLTMETGWVITNRDIKVMAAVVNNLINSSQVLEQRKTVARQQINLRHSWEINTAQLADQYQCLARKLSDKISISNEYR